MTVRLNRAHEGLEEQLRELMGQDSKAHARRDKLLAELRAVEEELTTIAVAKVELMNTLAGIVKKQAGKTEKHKAAPAPVKTSSLNGIATKIRSAAILQPLEG